MEGGSEEGREGVKVGGSKTERDGGRERGREGWRDGWRDGGSKRGGREA